MKVLVLGAGIVGVAAAWYLADAGHEVEVIDREAGAALGTSWANAGQMPGAGVLPWVSPAVPATILRHFGKVDAPYLIHLKPDPAIWLWAIGFLRNCTRARVTEITANLRRLAEFSLAETQALRAAENIIYDLSTRGILHTFAKAEGFDKAARAAAQEPEAARPRVLDRQAALALEPALAARPDMIAGALHYDRDESGDCNKFATGLAAAATRRGVRFNWGETVTDIIVENGRATGARTNAGEQRADVVVMCLGSASAPLTRRAGLRIPVYPVKGYAATIPVGPGAPDIAIMDRDIKAGILRIGDRLRIAGTAELAGYNTHLDTRRARALLAAMMKRFPEGGDASQAELWTGLRPMTPNCLPLLGETPLPGLMLNTGHGSLGWTLACGSGRVIAEIVSGRPAPVDMRGLQLRRLR
ncbi:MAG: D-amino acid dehydrogenase [Alphaproteobacteria bacterium]|jgi:D-amino-acid dehydrogenase|nr:D-amino acid dehydrogenase [Alphaproteobacteria bacterium]